MGQLPPPIRFTVPPSTHTHLPPVRRKKWQESASWILVLPQKCILPLDVPPPSPPPHTFCFLLPTITKFLPCKISNSSQQNKKKILVLRKVTHNINQFHNQSQAGSTQKISSPLRHNYQARSKLWINFQPQICFLINFRLRQNHNPGCDTNPTMAS